MFCIEHIYLNLLEVLSSILYTETKIYFVKKAEIDNHNHKNLLSNDNINVLKKSVEG